MARTPSRLVAVATIALACGGGNPPATGVRPLISESRLSVEVENLNFYDATIYAYSEGVRIRLGVVDSEGSRTFSFNWTTGSIRFLVDFFANGCMLTDRIFVDAGDQLLVVLETQDFRKASKELCAA